MKKQSVFFLVAIIPMVIMTSCGKNQAKDAKLTNQNDSLSYSLGIANGDAIKQYYMTNVENEDEAINAFMTSLDKAFNSTEEPNDMYNVGLQVGGSFKQQEKEGFMGNPDLEFNADLAKQGFMAAIGEAESGMTVVEAERYIQKVMMELQEESMKALQQQDATEEIIDVEDIVK